jgi:undecaprenyl-diphosphatase
MTILNAIILGIIQGLTEFLPVSSSGHLIIARHYLGIQSMDGLAFDAVLQLATILAVGLYFWRDIWGLAKSFFKLITRKAIVGKEATLFWAIFVGTIPAIILGLFFENLMDTVFRNIHLVALTLVLGSLLMFFAEKFAKQNKELTIEKGFLAGLFQTLALLPGVSRSGATISGGLFLGFTREEATRFSFLLAFPIILGSGLKKLYDLYQGHELIVLGPPLFVSSIFAFVVGLGAIHFLITYLKKHTLYAFVVYRLLLVVVLLALF